MNNQVFVLLRGFCRLLAIGWLFDAIAAAAYMPNQLWLSFRGGRPVDVAGAAILTTAFHTFLDLCFAAIFWFCASSLARLVGGRESSTSPESLNPPKV
jgi:hypothetical protein